MKRTILSTDQVAALIIRAAEAYEGMDEEEINRGEMTGSNEVVDYFEMFLADADNNGGFGTKYLLNLYDIKTGDGITLKSWVHDAIRGNGSIDVSHMSSYWNLVDILTARDRTASKQVTCQRCGHTWLPRTARPAVCPNCGSARWDTMRTGNEPGRRPRERKNNERKSKNIA
jgi:rubrerythrin